MLNTSLCYIKCKDKVLMLHRTKKDKVINKDKWIGIGGHFEPGETPQECALREIFEETGLTVTDMRYRGVVTFHSDIYPSEQMHLFSVYDFEGEITECDEGELEWIEKSKLLSLPMWEGDKIFLKLIANPDEEFFHLTLNYCGDTLQNADLNKNI